MLNVLAAKGAARLIGPGVLIVLISAALAYHQFRIDRVKTTQFEAAKEFCRGQNAKIDNLERVNNDLRLQIRALEADYQERLAEALAQQRRENMARRRAEEARRQALEAYDLAIAANEQLSEQRQEAIQNATGACLDEPLRSPMFDLFERMSGAHDHGSGHSPGRPGQPQAGDSRGDGLVSGEPAELPRD